MQSSDDDDHKSTYVYMEFPSGYDGTDMYFSFEWETDFYEVSTSETGESVLVPYVSTVNEYHVHKVFMGAGGVLLLLVALVLSPLPIGTYFERFFPIYNKRVRS